MQAGCLRSSTVTAGDRTLSTLSDLQAAMTRSICQTCKPFIGRQSPCVFVERWWTSQGWAQLVEPRRFPFNAFEKNETTQACCCNKVHHADITH